MPGQCGAAAQWLNHERSLGGFPSLVWVLQTIKVSTCLPKTRCLCSHKLKECHVKPFRLSRFVNMRIPSGICRPAPQVAPATKAQPRKPCHIITWPEAALRERTEPWVSFSSLNLNLQPPLQNENHLHLRLHLRRYHNNQSRSNFTQCPVDLISSHPTSTGIYGRVWSVQWFKLSKYVQYKPMAPYGD